jgi:hypothetical protein
MSETESQCTLDSSSRSSSASSRVSANHTPIHDAPSAPPVTSRRPSKRITFEEWQRRKAAEEAVQKSIVQTIENRATEERQELDVKHKQRREASKNAYKGWAASKALAAKEDLQRKIAEQQAQADKRDKLKAKALDEFASWKAGKDEEAARARSIRANERRAHIEAEAVKKLKAEQEFQRWRNRILPLRIQQHQRFFFNPVAWVDNVPSNQGS